MADDDNYPPRPATPRVVERAIDILDVLARYPAPVRLVTVAKETRFAKSTAYRILAALVNRGYAARSDSNYTLGPRLLKLTTEKSPLDRLQMQLMPFLVELYEHTNGAVCLGVLSNGHVLLSPPVHNLRYPVAPRTTVPAYRSAVGKLLLAYHPEAITGKDLGGYAGATGQTTAQLELLHQELQLIRRRGVATVHGREIELAVPVFSPGPRLLTGIKVSGVPGVLDVRSAITRMTQLAHAASAYLSRTNPVE